MTLTITLASGPYDRVRAFQTGDVRVEGADVRFVAVTHPPELFARMIRDREFDVAEMSLGYYISAHARGNLPFVALPVFPSRVFRHGFIFVNTRAGIRSPADLEGRRIGVSGFRQTAAVWIRGLLREEHGLDLTRVRWIEGGVNRPQGGEDALAIPTGETGLSIEAAPAGRTLDEMLVAGEIDALIGAERPRSLGKSTLIARLFPDYRGAERVYFRKTGIFPPMHTVVMRRELHERHPWLAESLYKGFEDAKAWAKTQMRYVGALRYMLPWLSTEIEEIDELFGGDPFPSGLEANRNALEAMVRHLVADGLLPHQIPIEGLFAPIVGQGQRGAPVTG
jgi:4,5-dihydroxyphthalate decarboxylase